MGMVSTEQTVAIIDSVANALRQPTPVVVPVIPEPWWEILSIVVGSIVALGGLILGFIKLRAGKKRSHTDDQKS